MKKYSLKYVVISSVSIGLFVFLMSLIANFILVTISPNLIQKIIVLFAIGILTGTGVTYAIIVLSPIYSDWIIMLRRLLRFDNLSHPLIERLSYEAPGTYHHSINVSILAQQAAKAIRADALLVRISAYYHDIGKLEEPLRFIENQAGHEIPHSDDLNSIKESAERIIDHVAAGIKIAKTYNLPENIINMIAEHHGTTRVLYFFELAKEKKIKIKTTDFKYPGPVPQTKEAALLMLADSIEAATRSSSELNNVKIEEIVKNVLNDRKKENQFKRCNFTSTELYKINKSFVSTLKSIYHQRINYKKNE